jgi:hypothetical protein
MAAETVLPETVSTAVQKRFEKSTSQVVSFIKSNAV